MVSWAGVRAHHDEVVRKTRDADALVSGSAAAPGVIEGDGVEAGDGERGGGQSEREAGREDDGVDLVLASVRRHDAFRTDLGDRVGDEIDVVAFHRRPVVIQDEHALAAKLEIGAELRAERRIGHAGLEMSFGHVLADFDSQGAFRKMMAPSVR